MGGQQPVVEVRVLGPAELAIDGAPVDVRAPKERALLACLALRADRPVALHELAGALWGDPPPASFRKSLQVHVSRLRRRVEAAGLADGTELVATVDEGYRLALAADAVDLHRFESGLSAGRDALATGDAARAVDVLAAALDEWRSGPLPELADGTLGQGEGARLCEARAEATDLLVEAELALGRHDALVGRLEQLVGEEPLREQRWGLLMLALYRAGRQADALRAYQRARSFLVDELGIEPGAELRRLEAAIVAQDAELDLGPAPSPPPPDSPVVLADSGAPAAPAAACWWEEATREPPWVGRVDELAALESAYGHAAEGSPTIVTVAGQDGVGKTRLAAELAALAAADGALVVRGAADPGDQGPFGLFRHALDQWVLVHEPDPSAWPAAAARALAGLSPRLADRAGVEPDPSSPSDAYLVADALREVSARALGDRPLVLVLDDLHWADPASLQMVRQVLRTPSGWGLLVVATYRDTAAPGSPDLLDLLAELHARPGVLPLQLGPLAPDEAVALLSARVGGAAGDDGALALATLAEEAGGVPAFLLALADHLVDRRREQGPAWTPGRVAELGLPRALAERIDRRARTLDERDRVLLGSAAVLGPTFAPSTLAAVGGVEPVAAIAAVEAAVRAGLVVETGPDRAAFANAVVWRAVYDRLSASRRAEVHRRAGEVLALRDGAPVEERVPDAADQFEKSLRAGGRDGGGAAEVDARYADAFLAAVAEVEAAAGQVEGTGLDRPERRCQVVLGLAEARRRQGDLAGARLLFERAAAEARSVGRPDLLARSAVGVAGVCREIGVSHPPVVELLREAAEQLDPDDALQGELAAALVPELVWARDWRAALEVGRDRATAEGSSA